MRIVKICKHHGDLTIDQVRICASRKSNPVMICIFCSREKTRKSRLKKIEKERERKRKHYAINSQKYINYSNQYKLNNPEAVKQTRRLYERRKFIQRKAWTLKYKFNITIEQYDSMLLEQKNCCAICKRKESARVKNAKDNQETIKSLSVDHCHISGKLRELLCDSCNRGLGFFKDSIESLKQAILYLEKHKPIV